MSVPLIDLKAQYKSIEEEIKTAVSQVLDAGQYILGPNVKALEQEVADFCGVDYGVGVANGTDALLLTLLAYGIGPGDEVITTPYTFFATAEVISQVGAKPVFIDIDPLTYNLNVNLIEKAITSHTRAIMPVHIFGQIAPMDEIMALADKYNLVVIEDACQAIGARYKGQRAGGLGHAACFSFFPTKNLGGYGDGGMVVTNNDEVNARIKVLRVHGSNKKYIHSVLGFNSRLDEIQAAILRVKLKYLDKWNQNRRDIAALYAKELGDLPGLVLPYVAPENESIYHLYILRSNKRDQLLDRLKEEKIGCAVYYPVPLHLQEVYQNLGYKTGDLPEADRASLETLALPMFPDMTEEQVRKVAGVVKEVEAK